MSLVWNMYGGSDFSRSTREEERKHAGFEVHYTSHGAEIYTAPHTSPKGKKVSQLQMTDATSIENVYYKAGF